MADLVRQGAVWLESKRVAHRANTVTVWRGGLSFSAQATKGSSDLTAVDEDGVIIKEVSEDFIISVSEYDFGKGPVEPEADDKIVDSSSGTAVSYQVLPMVAEDAKRYSDSYRLSWRIHTKEAEPV